MNIKDSINDLAASTFEEIQRVEKEYQTFLPFWYFSDHPSMTFGAIFGELLTPNPKLQLLVSIQRKHF